MAMLRVSSYRRLFEEDIWSRNGGLSKQCAGEYRTSARAASVNECDCDKLDFVAAKALNKEGLSRFVQERTIIAALNDRLVQLIELAHCFEEENESLECQIVEVEEKLKSGGASSSISPTAAEAHCSLDAVVGRLRRERDEILCDTEELRKELELLMKEYEKAAQQRVVFQQERRDVAEEVDAVTAGCLALREQVAIYEEQLANMEAQHKTLDSPRTYNCKTYVEDWKCKVAFNENIQEVESLLEPAGRPRGAAAALGFRGPDITPALDVKEYYCQLAESLQYECGPDSSAVVHSADGKQLEVRGAAGSTAKDLPKMKNISEIKMLISELQKELADLEKRNEELEEEAEMKKAAYMDEIAELECTIDEMQHQEADFQVQMKEQCEDYKELLSEKMARDMEIVAYRSLVEEEEARLCNL